MNLDWLAIARIDDELERSRDRLNQITLFGGEENYPGETRDLEIKIDDLERESSRKALGL